MENKLVIEIKPEQYFLLRNGRLIRSISELADTLKTIDNETFTHHVNDGRNDFSTWIRDVFNDSVIADRISGLKDRGDIIRELEIYTAENKKTVVEDIVQPKIAEVPESPRIKIPDSQKKKQEKLPLKKSIIKNQNALQVINTPRSSDTIYESIRDELNKIIKDELKGKLEEILTREREIEIREEKIEAIENRIEKNLSREKKKPFFSWDFIQGLIIGALLAIIILLVYQKFYLF